MAEELVENIEETSETPASPTSIDDLKPKMKVKGKVSRLELYGAFI
ncbi:hypothetical protein GWO43_28840, partial [candidate division KSB1 bacterium]|nr:hypothetical protein [Phycisphaerae bacterium]NIR52602.1 hypothetical protein [candidate division KSB1 bacterium]NIT74796.1 hypothetical protein [candidate division KSB1 bacterium]NIU28570.1 hypothetical protein [candidate division KSB1 bacterium]NIU90391.1 hypothetical protein [candidate division KSB1 bacterium]